MGGTVEASVRNEGLHFTECIPDSAIVPFGSEVLINLDKFGQFVILISSRLQGKSLIEIGDNLFICS